MQQTDFTPDVSTQTIADASPDVEMTATVCWYEDGEGYLVPVTRQIPLQDGVAKATLSLMVKSSENDLAAARMGLRNVIPEGVTFDLDISGGKARVDLSKEALSCQNAEEELLTMMIAQECGLRPGDFVHTLGDAHLYLNHADQVAEQLSRTPRPLPTLRLNPAVRSVFDFRYEDFTLENYDPWPAIKAPMSF